MSTLKILNLRVDYRTTEIDPPYPDVPYAIVNCVFKCERDPDNHDVAWNLAKVDSEEFRKILTIDDPEAYEDWITHYWDLSESYSGYGKAWTHNDPPWRYIEKFDVFWFREWVADSIVTNALISELSHYKEYGKLPSVYRAADECIILSHLRTLSHYWD